MSFDVLVREALPTDAAAMRLAVIAVHTKTGNLKHAPQLAIESEEEQAARIQRMTAQEDNLMLLAEDMVHGQVVGTLTCRREAELGRTHAAVLDLLVVPAWLGRGADTALLKEAIGWARRHKYLSRLELVVPRHPAINFADLEALGFVREGTAHGWTRINNKLIDAEYLALNNVRA
ncbi:MAG: GNAT family N-acetyltransferase [Chloroflexota bacterium]